MSNGLKIGLIIGGSVVGLVLAVCLGFFIWFNNIDADGVAQETELSSEYLDCQNYLSNYVSKFYESVGIANLKSDKINQILQDAVKGRYTEATTGKQDRQAMVSVIKEAYPDLKMEQYDKIIDIISAGRDAFRNKQSKLLDMLRSYDNWVKGGGFIHKWATKRGGFPSRALEARIGKDVVTGAEARDRMWTIVTTESTRQAYETGTMDPLNIYGKNGKPAGQK
jgi:hypothetical protein